MTSASLFLKNKYLLVLSVLVIFVAGFSAFVSMPRLEDPRIVNRNPLIVTLVPGASAERVEALVTEKLEDKLHQVLRLESVGQLAGGVAHNFNNALTAISGYSELLARRFSSEDPALRDLEQIQRVAERSAHLTRQLLACSRHEDVHPSIFNVNEAVESTRDLLSPLLPRTTGPRAPICERGPLPTRTDHHQPGDQCERRDA